MKMNMVILMTGVLAFLVPISATISYTPGGCQAMQVRIYSSFADANEPVTILSDIGDEVAGFEVSQNGKISTHINTDIQAIEVSMVNIEGEEYHQIRLPGGEQIFAGQIAQDGQPDLPVMTTFLAVPDQAGVNFAVEYSNYEIIEDINIAPSQPSQPESGIEISLFTLDEAVYNRDEFFPGDLAEVEDPVIMRDLRFVKINLYPVQYNPVRKQLKIYHNLSVSLSYGGGDVVNPKTYRRQYLSDGFYPIYKAIIANFDQFFATTEVRRGGYLILAKDIFVDSLKAVADWKHKKGYTVHIAPTSEIDPNGDNPTQYEVLSYLENAYDTWEVPPEYVMIVGDEDNTSFSGIPDYPYSGYASDHPYSMVEGNDYLPDIFVSRLSVDNMSQLRVAVSKILTYESQPFMDDPDYWLRGLSVAGNIYATTPRITVLWVRELLFANGFLEVDTSFAWNSYDPGPAQTLEAMNRGVSIVSYRGWAGPSGWYDPSFDNGNLNQVQYNNKIGVMASIVCGTGNFGSSYSDPCFGETWIRMGSLSSGLKGGPAFFGSTDGGTHTRWNNPIMTGYYWGIFAEDIYHFAAAAVRGKIQQYNTFPQYRQSEIRKYFHTYNMLGDPELEIRTIVPQIIDVDHPDTLPFGINSLEINVADAQGFPIGGAFVTVIKGHAENEEVFECSKTDEAGNVIFSFDAQSPDTMYVTVSGHNLYPYQGFVFLEQSEMAVGYDSLAIDDDDIGDSEGNGDGIANPGEIIEINVRLKNFGNVGTSRNTVANLMAIDDEILTVYEGERLYGDIGPGESIINSEPFILRIDDSAPDGRRGRIMLTVVDEEENSWESLIEIPVSAPKLLISSVSFPGGNGRLDPGETLEMILVLENVGSLDADDVTGTITTLDDYATIIDADGNFGSIPQGGSADNSANPMIISSHSGTFDGRIINIVLHIATSNGVTSTIPFIVTVGNVLSSDPVGPDAYGYYMYDNTDIDYNSHPTYDWVEIVPNLGGQGTRLNFSNNDDYSVLVNLPFNLSYYGETYSDIIVCTNGFVAVDTAPYDMGGTYWYNFYNWPIPDPGNARGQISPFWDDLSYSGSTYGVYKWHDVDNHRFVIEWYHMSHRNTGSTETFEMIITDPAYYPTITGDAEIYYQYHTIYNNDSGELYSSVGFESYDQLRGIEYTFDNSYTPGAATLTSNRAIRITTNTGRGAVSGNVDLSNFGFNQGVRVSISSGQYRITPQSGDYWIREVPPGTHDVVAETNGYFPITYEGVNVELNTTTTGIDFSMNRCPIPESLEVHQVDGNDVLLIWHNINHENLDGFNIYRSPWQDGEFAKLNSSPVSDTTYSDYPSPDQSIYWYYVTAAFSDIDWNVESLPSNLDYVQFSENPGGIAGTVTDYFAIPIEGVGVIAIGSGVSDYTNDNGEYHLAGLVAGLYDISFSHPAFRDTTVTGVIVAPEETTILDVTMLSGCVYIPGDCDHNGEPATLPDVIAMIGMYRGSVVPPYECSCPPHGDNFSPTADPNGNCVPFELGDVVTEIAAYRGTGTASGCEDCPGSLRLGLARGDRLPVIPSLRSKKKIGKSSVSE